MIQLKQLFSIIIIKINSRQTKKVNFYQPQLWYKKTQCKIKITQQLNLLRFCVQSSSIALPSESSPSPFVSLLLSSVHFLPNLTIFCSLAHLTVCCIGIPCETRPLLLLVEFFLRCLHFHFLGRNIMLSSCQNIFDSHQCHNLKRIRQFQDGYSQLNIPRVIFLCDLFNKRNHNHWPKICEHPKDLPFLLLQKMHMTLISDMVQDSAKMPYKYYFCFKFHRSELVIKHPLTISQTQQAKQQWISYQQSHHQTNSSNWKKQSTHHYWIPDASQLKYYHQFSVNSPLLTWNFSSFLLFR